MKLRCNNKVCENYVWDYKGKKGLGLRTSCPSCGFSVRITEHIPDEHLDVEVEQ